MKGTHFALVTLCFQAVCVTTTAASCPYDAVGLQPWGDASTWGGTAPQNGDQVVITSVMNVLLNVSPPPLGSITIEEGGSLIWGNVPNITLTVSYILVKGNFEIGAESAECRFTKKANIILTGLTNSTLFVEEFGRKFIGVAEKGTVEFHGGIKQPWTKLIQTVPAGVNTCGVIYNHQKEAFSTEINGLHAVAFNLDGSVFDVQVLYTTNRSPKDTFETFGLFLKAIPVDKILFVYLQRSLGRDQYPNRPWDQIAAAIEEVGGLTSGSSVFRKVMKSEAYAFVTRTGDSTYTKEDYDDVKTEELISDIPETSLQFIIQDGSTTDIVVINQDVFNPKIKLLDDVSSWKEGDKIVVASTDFAWRQAEQFTVIGCTDCQNDEVRLDHRFKFMHYGEVTHGVDERAEVILLTRDIVIEGVLEDTCYANNDREKQLCTYFNADTFGGHFKILRGFTAAHIEQVEFYHMGQQAVLGSYPIHFHMCDDVDGAWVRSNSIHHSQARCITTHGTDGLELSYNVCYLHKGHGYFLEDSAEQRNRFDHNVGIGTEAGALLLTDMTFEMCTEVLKWRCNSMATFWITHPNNHFTNNVAGGSDKHGFQFSVAHEPLGPSKQRQLERGLVTKDSAKYTKIAEFKNNVAHSNADRGLFIDGFLFNGGLHRDIFVPENGFFMGASHTPRDPPNKDGTVISSVIENFLGYKNIKQNVWTSAGIIIIDHATLADSPSGIAMSRAQGITYSMVNNSMFIGETDNVGNPKTGFNRSYASRDLRSPLRGMEFYQGPVLLRNSFFDVYKHETIGDKFRPAGAIGFKLNNPYPSTTNSDAEGIKFGFCDSTEGNYVFDSLHGELPHFGNQDGNRQINFRNKDGSVTSTPNTQVVKSGIRFITNPCCVLRKSWNMEICPLRYAKVLYRAQGGAFDHKYPVYMRRDDRPDDVHSILGKMGLPFLLIKSKSYTLYFNGTAPEDLQITGHDFETGDFVRIGICYNKDVTNLELTTRDILGAGPGVGVNSIEELDASENAQHFFWDKARGLFFFKVTSYATRVDGEKCPGGACPRWTIKRTGGSDTQPDCYDDAYNGVYNKAEDPVTDDCEPTTAPVCQKSTSEGFGAPIIRPDNFDLPFEVTCPAPATLEEGRTEPELKGCYRDSYSYRDIGSELQVLFRSMTPKICIERCYHRGYIYAALQNGRECRCGNVYGVYGEDAAKCTTKCSGDKEETCGGRLRNQVYSTGKAAGASSTSCGAGDKGAVIGGECLYLSADKLKYWDAQKACVVLGGNLATVSSAEMQADIIKYIRPLASDVWFGLHDAYHEGELVSVDGTSATAFTYFHSYVDNRDSNDYAYMYAKSIFRWLMTTGKYSKHYLCSIPASGNENVAEPCGSNNHGKRLGASGSCYAVINDKNRYAEAAHQCWIRNGIPAPADDPDTLKEIVKHVQLFGTSGTNYYVGSGGHFEDMYIELVYQQLYNASEVKYWAQNGIVCLIETVNAAKPCSSGWTQFEDNCYLYQGAIVKSESSFPLCDLGTSHLVTVDSEKENTFVGDLVKNFKQHRRLSVALFVKYEKTSATFKNLDGSALAFSNWGSNQGDKNTRRGECVVFSSQDANFTWYNKSCSSLYSAMVCKQPAAV